MEPGCVILVTGGTMDKANVMAVSWQTPIHTADPCMVLPVLNQQRYTYELIKRNNELVINVPDESLLEQTHFIGTVSGRKADKFKAAGLTPAPAGVVKPPLIAECAGHLECRITNTFTVDTHDLVLCKLVHALAEEEYFDGAWIAERFHPCTTCRLPNTARFTAALRSVPSEPPQRRDTLNSRGLRFTSVNFTGPDGVPQNIPYGITMFSLPIMQPCVDNGSVSVYDSACGLSTKYDFLLGCDREEARYVGQPLDSISVAQPSPDSHPVVTVGGSRPEVRSLVQ